MTFAPCYSKSPPPADFTPTPLMDFLDLRLLHQQLRVFGVSDLFTLSLFTFESNIVVSLITLIYSDRSNNKKT